jgi:beta-lactamase regulating signal transducer with metallopeptidase domain/ketosteroid isomerase-like protein
MSPESLVPQAWALLLETTVKGSLLLLGVALAAMALRHRSAADRHLAWTIGVIGLLVLPVLVLVVPDWPVALPEGVGRVVPRLAWEGAEETALGSAQARRGEETTTAEPAAGSRPTALDATAGPAAERPLPRLALVIVVVWVLGGLAVLGSFALAWARLWRVAHRATTVDTGPWRERVDKAAAQAGVRPRRVEVRRAAEPVTPLTWGVLRPVLILPPTCDEWTDAQARTVLLHEISHLRRHDPLTQTLASLACVLHWFNPLAWLAGRRMLAERERACDDQVLLSGAKASDYANDLLEIARTLGAPWPTSQVSTAMARRSQIAGRLLAVLDPHLARRGARPGRAALAVALGLAAVLPLAAVHAAPSGPSVRVVEASGPGSSAAPSSGAADLQADWSGLDAQNQALVEALRRGDPEAATRFYTADAELVVPLLPVARGRSAVRDLHDHLLSGGVTLLERFTIERYRVGPMVCEVGVSRFRTASGAVVQSSREMTLWRQEDGEWRIHREVSLPLGEEEKR